jgi:hypothetical protein
MYHVPCIDTLVYSVPVLRSSVRVGLDQDVSCRVFSARRMQKGKGISYLSRDGRRLLWSTVSCREGAFRADVI